MCVRFSSAWLKCSGWNPWEHYAFCLCHLHLSTLFYIWLPAWLYSVWLSAARDLHYTKYVTHITAVTKHDSWNGWKKGWRNSRCLVSLILFTFKEIRLEAKKYWQVPCTDSSWVTLVWAGGACSGFAAVARCHHSLLEHMRAQLGPTLELVHLRCNSPTWPIKLVMERQIGAAWFDLPWHKNTTGLQFIFFLIIDYIPRDKSEWNQIKCLLLAPKYLIVHNVGKWKAMLSSGFCIGWNFWDVKVVSQPKRFFFPSLRPDMDHRVPHYNWHLEYHWCTLKVQHRVTWLSH